MTNFKLNEKTKTYLSQKTGFDYTTLIEMSAEEIDKHIEQKVIKKKLKFSKVLSGMIGRGSLYIYFNRFFTRQTIEKELSRIKA